jgi:hypothetical protein
LDKEVIEKAKALGINISEITEKLLTVVTLRPKGNSYEDVIDAYGTFIYLVAKVLGKYKAQIRLKTIRGPPYYEEIILDEKGLRRRYFDKERNSPMVDRQVNPNVVFSIYHNPYGFLEIIINSLVEASLRNKEQITRLQFALKLVKALSEDEKGDEKE